MNKLSRQREQEIEMRRQLLPWLKKNNIHPVLFDKLQPHKKRLLHNCICVGNQEPPNYKLRELYKDLGLAETRSETMSENGRGGHEPTNEELKEIFRSDGTPYQKGF